jgi:hypothetical protein
MIINDIKDGAFIIRNSTLADAQQMEEVQRICFPTLAPNELLTRDHYANHIRIFPEGQLVIVDQDKVIASSSSFRTQFTNLDLSFMEATDYLWITKVHRSDGDWLYKFDMGILPAYRGLKLSKALYHTHQEWVKAEGMKGQITVGMPSGYHRYKERYSINEYCEKLKNNELTDPTITPQRNAGFQWVRPIFNYLEDPNAGNCGILMVWPVDSE